MANSALLQFCMRAEGASSSKKRFSLTFTSLFLVGCSISVIDSDRSQGSTNYLGSRSRFLTDIRVKEKTATELSLKYLDLDLQLRELEVGYIMLHGENEGEVKSMQERTKLALDSLNHIQAQEEETVTNAIANIDPLDAEGALELSLTTFQFEFRKIFGPSSRRWSAWNYRMGDINSFEKTCDDVVEHQLLGEIADSILKDDRARYVATLARLIRAIDCQNLETAVALDSGLAHAYKETLKRFPENMQRMVRRAMVSSLTNVMLAVYDETKVVGFTALSDWFAENRNAIAETYSTRYSAASLIGLWVREPAADRMTQLRTCEESHKNQICVSMAHLVDSLVDPMRLGLGNCGVAEMISPVMDNVGYLCQKGVCDHWNENSGFSLGKMSQYGARLGSLKENSCENGGIGTGGWNGQGGGLTGVGGGIASALISCTTDSISHSGARRVLSCASDVVSSMSAPLTPTYTPRPLNSCGNPLAEGNGENTSETPDPRITDSKEKEKLEKAKIQAEKEIKRDEAKIMSAGKKVGVTVTEEMIDKGIAVLSAAEGVTDNWWDTTIPPNSACSGKDGCTSPPIKNGLSVAIIRESYIREATVDQLADLLKHEAAHVILNNAGVAGKDQDQKINSAWHWGKSPDEKHHLLCEIDSACASSCSPAMEKLQDFSKCIEGQESPTMGAFRPVYDPSPDDAPAEDTNAAQWMECFQSRGGRGGLDLSATFCTAMTCSEGTPTVVGGRCQCGGALVSSDGMQDGTTNSCTWAMCPDGSGGRAAPDGSCRCEAAGSIPAVPPMPPSTGPKAPARLGDIYPF